MNKIYFTHDAFVQLNTYLKQKNSSNLFILVDENTKEHCLPLFLNEIVTTGRIEILEIQSGELHKNIHTCIEIWTSLLQLQADRKSVLINVGGGVITDMGGFVASSFMRGISFVNIPTTLLSMADASVGGKTGVDLANSKNIIGTFTVPEMVLVHPIFLETLAKNQLRSGFAEMLKHGLISSKNHWKNLIEIEKLSPNAISSFIKDTINIKKEVVEKDFKEENIRKKLNFGHTIGHGIESFYLTTHTPLLHGEAIALGMKYECEIACNKGILANEIKNEILQQLNKRFSDILNIKPPYKDILPYILKDKKNERQRVNMSLVSDIGKCEINCWVSLDEIKIVF